MLIRFRVANFRSLRAEQELSLVAAAREGRANLLRVESLGLDLVRVAGLFGANAAGKTNVVAAVRFMRLAVIDSHREWKPNEPVPREPFLSPEALAEPSLFEAELVIGGVSFQYGFKLDNETVLEEWLYAYPKKRRQIWFSRNAGAAEPFVFGKQLKGNNRFLAKLARKNSLFLSVAAENNHESLLPIYDWFATGLLVADSERRDPLRLTQTVLSNEPGRAAVVDLLRLADLGIVDVSLRRQPTGDEWLVQEIEFEHGVKGVRMVLPLTKESHGTQEWFKLAGPILRALERGSVLCVDELDASLHPRLSLELVRLFLDPVRNPRKAQLIFNTHDTTLLGNLLGEPSLHRDQVWFVEKDQEGVSRLYPLTDFKPRKLENLERGYLQGRYGANPFISSQLVIRDA